MRLHAFAVALLALGLLVPETVIADRLHLVDDRYEPIEAAVEVCLVVALERDCESIADGGLELPDEFDLLTVEGPDHGPVTLASADLDWSDGDSARAVVPRKAQIQLTGLPEDGATVSLYRVDDPGFRRPAVRRAVAERETLKIPAGRFLLSISGKGFAPDLRELDLQPAQELRLALRRHAGGSVVLRVQARTDLRRETPVPEVRVELRTSSLDLGPDAEPELLGETITSPSGLALFSGVEVSTADAALQHPDFLPETVPALAIEPGSFAFREVTVQRGGTLEAQVTLDGLALPNASCRLVVYDRVPSGDSEPTEIWGSNANYLGFCRGHKLREGDYFLRVEAPPPRGRNVWLDMPVAITEGETTRVTANLERVILEGSLLLGTKPAPGYRLVVHDLEAPKPYARDQDAAAISEADEDGRYRVTLWRPGRYRLHVQTPRGTPALVERTELVAGTQSRDFELASHEIEVRVVDERKRPIEGAAVSLTWQGTYHYRGFTNEDGELSFALTEETGSAQIRARSEGYFLSEPTEIEVTEGQPPPPVILVLERHGGIRGRLVAAGGPVNGGTVMSYQVEPFVNPRWLGQARTDPRGYFEIPQAKAGSTRVFFTGPRCPLGTAIPPNGTGEIGDSEGDGVWQLTCQPASVGLEIVLHEPDRTPRSGSGILLRRGGLVFPREVLATHLARARLPFVSDASGRLFLAGLEPETYELYLAEATSAAALRMGADRGFLAAVQLPPHTTRTVVATLQETIPQEVP